MAETLLTARQAAQRLGVKVESVYAYVSRGELVNRRARGTRASLFRSDDVERLRAKGRQSQGRPDAVAVLETALTAIDGTRLYYRGQDATMLCEAASFERVAEWLWRGQAGALTNPVPRWRANEGMLAASIAAQHGLPEETAVADRLRVIITAAAPCDAMRYNRDADAVCATMRTLLTTVVASLPTRGKAPRAPRSERGDRLSFATALWPKLTDTPATPAMLKLLNAALVLLCDHELATSTFAARVAASVRADPYSIVLSGLGAVSGALHGGMGPRVVRLLEQIPRPADVVPVLAEYMQQGARLPGLGHPLYDEGDPRGRAILTMLRSAPLNRTQSVRLAVADTVLDVAATHAPARPNVDFALASLCYVARMPASVAEGIFALARIVGWIAHALEEYREPGLRFRLRADYVGPRPAG